MEKILFAMAVLFTSCTPFVINTMNYEILETDLDTAWRETASFEYIADTSNYCKSPIEFERDGGGDCEDFAAYMMYLLGESSEMAIIEVDGKTHAIVVYDNNYIEPRWYNIYYENPNILYLFSYDIVMKEITQNGTKKL